MWASDLELARAVAREMVKLLRPQEPKDVLPPEPPPFKPEKPKRNETWLEQHQRRIRDDIRAGKAVSSNMLQPKPQPPKAPGQQRQLSNGIWSWWR